MRNKLPERRRFIRLDIPLKAVIKKDGQSYEVTTKNISPIGLRFEIGIELMDNEDLEVELFLPGIENGIGLRGKVVWHKKVSLEDDAPFDVGFEIEHVNESQKNVFLKYLCDQLYDSTFQIRA